MLIFIVKDITNIFHYNKKARFAKGDEQFDKKHKFVLYTHGETLADPSKLNIEYRKSSNFFTRMHKGTVR